MNSKNKIMNRKILISLIMVIISILCTLITSISYNGTVISYISDSYFPVWIFMLVLISHYGYTYYLHNKKQNKGSIDDYVANLKRTSKIMIFFLFVQILMSFSSLLDIIKYSNRKAVLVIIGIIAIRYQIVCINSLYSNLIKIFDNDIDTGNNKKISLYIVLYLVIYTLFVSLVMLNYYI